MNAEAQGVIAQMTIWMVMLAAIVCAPLMAVMVSDQNYYTLMIWLGVVAGSTWVVVARDRWWLPLPLGMAFGGMFYVGFKLYMHEIMLAVCLLPLVVNLAARKESMFLLRQRIPVSVLMLAAYLVFHWGICLMYNKVEGYGGAGSVSRMYMHAIWPMILFIAFYLFGSTRHLRTALAGMYIFYLLRFAMAFYMIFKYGGSGTLELDEIPMVPVINYVPVAGMAADLRGSSTMLACMSIVYFHVCRGFLWRGLHLLMIPVGFIGVLFGSGRVPLMVFLLLLFFWSLVTRKMLFIMLGGMFVGGLLGVLNIYPESINGMDPRVQRALSGFVFSDDRLAIKQETSVSDRFHAELRKAGWERWTEDFVSILVGHGVRPFDEAAFTDKTRDDVERKAEQAKFTGTYEKAIWTVLATLGVLGLVLYVNVLRFLLYDAVRALWNEGLTTIEHGFFFLGSFAILAWFAILFVGGGFPSVEIMMGLFAKTVYEDRLARRLREAQALAQPTAGARRAEPAGVPVAL